MIWVFIWFIDLFVHLSSRVFSMWVFSDLNLICFCFSDLRSIWGMAQEVSNGNHNSSAKPPPTPSPLRFSKFFQVTLQLFNGAAFVLIYLVNLIMANWSCSLSFPFSAFLHVCMQPFYMFDSQCSTKHVNWSNNLSFQTAFPHGGIAA